MLNKTKTGLLLFLIDHLQEIHGRTRIQKMLYLTDHIGWNVIRDYYFYQYGPYSERMRRELDMLVQEGLINEEEDKIDDEKTLYKYRMTSDGQSYLKMIDLQPSKLVSKTKEFLAVLSEIKTDDLEIMATLHYIKESEPEADTEELVKFVKSRRPSHKEDRIRENLEVFPLLESFVKN